MAYKKKVFISYDYENDKHYKNLLLAWDSNRLFDFSMRDLSADISINSYNAGPIKSTISRYINEATYFLVIIGTRTSRSEWVKWEIQKAYELNKRIIAVKTDRENISPDGLYGIGTNWAMSFTYDSITNAINNA